MFRFNRRFRVVGIHVPIHSTFSSGEPSALLLHQKGYPPLQTLNVCYGPPRVAISSISFTPKMLAVQVRFYSI